MKSGLVAAVVISAILMVASIAHLYTVNVELENQYNDLVQKYNQLIQSLQQKSVFNVDQVSSVHVRIRIWKAGVLILDEYHAGAVTDIGDNMTLFWQSGRTEYQPSGMSYMWNMSHIGIGNQGTLNTGSTVLPGEWNRTAITTWDNFGQSVLNYTTVIYPNTGPYTADCIGLYVNATGNYLYGYDTFTEVTGIDNTFTINIEFQVSVSHT